MQGQSDTNKFPHDFVWGTATSSYQIEGGVSEGGRGETIWDIFSHTPGKVHNNQNGDIACDHYHRFKEDVALLKALGVTAYRFSIAWSRIQPTGRGKPNKEGLEFYNALIDELIENGIEPWITLYHWDLPLELHTDFNGWLNPEIADFFALYADICFENFGDRVKHWITINEAWVISLCGYGSGVFAPGIQSKTAPFIAGHNLLRAHGRAASLYRTKYQTPQKGVIGMTNNCDWREPATADEADIQAAQRANEFFLGWFADPIYFGKYPDCMRMRLGKRLPEFSAEESAMIKNSSDFFGLNHYSTELVSELKKPSHNTEYSIFNECGVKLSSDPSWKKTAMGWNIVPQGLEKLLCWIDGRYNQPEIYITENGCATEDTDKDASLNDQSRIDYLNGYLQSCRSSISKGVKLRGYFLWSLMDNFEWAHGYEKQFGIHHVDYKTLERTPKKSAEWYKAIISLS
ncbi:MAG: beta-glucosidase [Candidatus Wallbacteria bacterium HGW-Wallbacteria-1]|jgi:beta-glucosidase|uniref:Beta-glucosidase n=1 Tax=Candidatus Wallbacteria bacterium HGW-Wallbacteria-1 TaxID=2013854 RepID=A0A2N1PKY8_9BACT|nr:MAG: beta-glucosidase [Candidatus Wallbacteria bacterium HGW-Wallbacteria-1]